MPPPRLLPDRERGRHGRGRPPGALRHPRRRSHLAGGGDRGEPELLASAYERSFELAAERGAASIALPSLGTGAYGYPLERAAPIALAAALAHLESGEQPREVTFVLFGARALSAYEAALAELRRAGSGEG